ncbi:uncharacterized protein LOC110102123 [Dendrobium catenatum]|uniref:uncharacterized protein LOC110102123 n=1 Tax=Dendrobium catenatum TaxID=906689 RepID=UPI0009F371AA|nr:uncharacterized protein LOC110102123 [Dendrobium catenatum]
MGHQLLPSSSTEVLEQQAFEKWDDDGRFLEDDSPDLYSKRANDGKTPSASNYNSETLTDTDDHLSRTLSDHSPLLININSRQITVPSQFRFQNMWLLNNTFFEVVKYNWQAPLQPNNSIVGMKRLWFKLKRLKQVLNWWNHNVFRNIFSNVLQAEQCVPFNENLCQNDPSDVNFSMLNQSKLDLFNFQVQEEVFWKQKAGAKHLDEGDSNTKYFQSLTKRKRMKNSITNIQREDGSFSNDNAEIANLVVRHFKKHFNKAFTPIQAMYHSFIPNLLSNEDNVFLSSPPSLEEVKDTIFGMNSDSVAGPDGYTTLFF